MRMHGRTSACIILTSARVCLPCVRGSDLSAQEYSPEFTHLENTLGIAGRPGGPDFYFSLVENVRNHGPVRGSCLSRSAV